MRHFCVVVACAAIFSLSAAAGDLNPTGPPDSSMTTLDEMEPRIPVQSLSGTKSALFVISQPGSYYLTGNIDGEALKSGIEISVRGVTLDLNGFGLRGVNGSLDGIVVTTAATDQRRIEIHSGSISDWGGSGIDAESSRATRIHDIIFSGGNGTALELGQDAEVSDCVFENIGTHAIQGTDHVSVRGVTIEWTGGMGIRLGDNAEVLDCTVINAINDGIHVQDDSLVARCLANMNGRTGGDGISLGEGGMVRDCSANDNGQRGIMVENGVAVVDCALRGNGADGIVVEDECTVTGCTVTQSDDNGLVIGNYNHISDNNFTWNGNDSGGLSDGGMMVLGEFNVIRGNTFIANVMGVLANHTDAHNNLIISNLFAQNGNTVYGGLNDDVAAMVDIESTPAPESSVVNIQFD